MNIVKTLLLGCLISLSSVGFSASSQNDDRNFEEAVPQGPTSDFQNEQNEQYPILTRSYSTQDSPGFCSAYRCYIYSPGDSESCRWVGWFSC